MAATNRIAGIASVTVDGVTILLQGELEYSAADLTRESLAGQDQVHGFKEMPSAPFIAGTFRDTNNLSVKDFNNMTDVTVNLQLANGKSIIGNNMWTVNAQTVKATEATFEVRWEGKTGSVTEVL